MKTPPLTQELADLLELFCLGELTVSTAKRLEELAVGDPVHREHLVRFTMMHASALRYEAIRPRLLAHLLPLPEVAAADVPPVAEEPPTVAPKRRRTRADWRRSLIWARLAAAVVFVTYFTSISWNMLGKKLAYRAEPPVARSAAPDASDDLPPVAAIRGSEDAVWKSQRAVPASPASAATQQPAEISRGKPLQLAAGVVQLQLEQGVTLLVEGPAEWTIEGRNSATLHRGKLVAQVPRGAIGFLLNTPQGSIIDLGTEFGVEVSEQGAADVHVLRGQVSVQPTAAGGQVTSRRIEAGQSAHVTRHGTTVSSGAATPRKFERLMAAEERMADHRQGVDVLFHYRLGEDDLNAQPDGQAAEKSIGLGTQGSRHPLIRVGTPRYAAGAPQPHSDLALNVPGGNELAGYVGQGYQDLPLNDVMFEAWVRPRSARNSIVAYMGDSALNGFGLVIDDGKWALLYGGFACKHGEAVRLGEWTHVAWVREVRQGQLFVNGVPSGPQHQETPIPPETRLSLGYTSRDARQTFDGEIDEVRLVRLEQFFKPSMFLGFVASDERARRANQVTGTNRTGHMGTSLVGYRGRVADPYEVSALYRLLLTTPSTGT